MDTAIIREIIKKREVQLGDIQKVRSLKIPKF